MSKHAPSCVRERATITRRDGSVHPLFIRSERFLARELTTMYTTIYIYYATLLRELRRLAN